MLLLDVNVLIAWGWSEHSQHAAALTWMKSEPHRWATCPLTECGFLRIGSNVRITPGAATPSAAHAALQGLRKQPGHAFWPDDYSPADDELFAKLQGHNQITDAYLLALVHRRKGKLATFDRAIQALAKEAYGHSKNVLLVPV